MHKVFAAVIVAFASTAAGAQSKPYVSMSIHVDHTRAPKSMFTVVGECAQNAFCAGAVKAIGAMYGVPAGETLQVVGTFSRNVQGEGTHVFARLPGGYTYCRAEMKMTSIVPHDGPRGALFMGQSRPDGLYYETWTPVQPVGGGNTWVEADIAVVGVREELAGARRADGTCGTPMRVLWYCRGGGCRDTLDRGQSKDASSPPGAGGEK